MRLRGPRRNPHDWASWTSYVAAHEGRLASLDHFVLEDRVERIVGTDVAHWRGWILCADGYEVHVRRGQAVETRQGIPWVKTSFYAYHACHRHQDGRVVNLFRYDNIHEHEGHASRHHRHRYRNGLEIMPPEHVGEAGWPNLGQVLDELHELWVARIG